MNEYEQYKPNREYLLTISFARLLAKQYNEPMSDSQDARHLANQFLIAMPGMLDSDFSGSVIYMFEHNERGAMGLVIKTIGGITLVTSSSLTASARVAVSPPLDVCGGYKISCSTNTTNSAKAKIIPLFR